MEERHSNHLSCDMGYTEFTIGVEEENEVAKHIYFSLALRKQSIRGRAMHLIPVLICCT